MRHTTPYPNPLPPLSSYTVRELVPFAYIPLFARVTIDASEWCKIDHDAVQRVSAPFEVVAVAPHGPELYEVAPAPL